MRLGFWGPGGGGVYWCWGLSRGLSRAAVSQLSVDTVIV